jgi:transposase-like protein
MSQEVQPTTVKKTRARRSPEMIAELILEAERKGNAAELCRRENIQPTLFYRWKSRFKEGGISQLKTLKRGPKSKDPEKSALERENERLKTALCESSIELQLLKKSVR